MYIAVLNALLIVHRTLTVRLGQIGLNEFYKAQAQISSQKMLSLRFFQRVIYIALATGHFFMALNFPYSHKHSCSVYCEYLSVILRTRVVYELIDNCYQKTSLCSYILQLEIHACMQTPRLNVSKMQLYFPNMKYCQDWCRQTPTRQLLIMRSIFFK